MQEYNYLEIEKKWQKRWEEKGRFHTQQEVKGKENAYVLVEFPYPSGKGLHCGHVFAYVAPDIVARTLRLQGKNVLFPFGLDAFGLEAERTAIREKIPPQEIVKRNEAIFYEQIKMLGFGIDWSRKINSSDPEYYKWTQWLFLQFYKMGQVYKGEANVNWCPSCGVLANEEIEDGKCCQCKSETTQKARPQWMFKMTSYADRLIDDLDKTDYLPYVKLSQTNYVGRSYGVEVEFAIEGGGSFSIFTTCIETIYGITFMVIAPDGKLVQKLKPRIENWAEAEAYIKQSVRKSEFERTQLVKEKSGCLLKGIVAVNPVNGKKVPVYLGDFVLAEYGTGAVMAVPSHDQRDFEFAEHFGIGKIQVIEGDTRLQAVEKGEYVSSNAKLLNSAQFSGMTVSEAKKAITGKLVNMGVARETKNFKMHDWVFARQRYWGEPIPIVYCNTCGMVPVPENELPLVLPKVESYEPTKDGQSPLATATDWVNCSCPKCGAPSKRETDTMPGWAGSSWYFLRYCDPQNSKEFASKDALAKWLPVSQYFGGNEHTTRHLLYARYWTKMLFDLGLVPADEFCIKRYSHGIILGENGVKMSKTLGNVVDPRDVIQMYGSDAMRLGIVFMGDFQDTFPWSENSIRACNKFLNKVWSLQEILTEGDEITHGLLTPFHTAIKKMTTDIENIKYNTAVAAMMGLLNEIKKIGKITRKEYQTFLTLLNPFAPHITEELWEICTFIPSIKDAVWPVCDEKYLVQDEVNLPVQVNGKMKKLVLVLKDADEAAVTAAVKQAYPELLGGTLVKTILIPNKIVNFILK